jgi:ComF family protein
MSLLFPEICTACKGALMDGETLLCLDCRVHLPRTNFHQVHDNPVNRLFYGRVPLAAATSLFYFKKQSKVQNLVHGLKYKSQKELSNQLGNMIGADLRSAEPYRETQVVVPVPLHKAKLKSRGYNQSEGFAVGIGNIIGCEVYPDGLTRSVQTSTQTRKTRTERWENVKDVFIIEEPSLVYQKRVLIVDDVVTTGATLEACCNAVLEAGAATVSIATIAYAEI